MNIGTLTGQIALEDELSSQLTIIASRVRKFSEGFGGSFGAATIAVGALGTAVVGVAGTILALGSKGDVIHGVENAFDRLARQAGSTGEALSGALDKGLRSTVDSMEIMQATTTALQAGVRLTEADMTALGATARAMAKATGGDAAGALNTLSSALTTGRTRGLALAGVITDVRGEEVKLAQSLGVTRDNLNAAGKLEAARIAILEGVRNKVKQLGDAELTLRERIQQVAVSVGNWFDNLAKAVAVSPKVTRAFDSIKAALGEAFGNTSQRLLDGVIAGINKFADLVASVVPATIRGVSAIVKFLQDNADTIKKLAIGVTAYATAWSALTIGSTIVTGVVAGLRAIQVAALALQAGSLVALITPIGLVATAVAGLAVAVYDFNKQMSQVGQTRIGSYTTEEGKAAEELTVKMKALEAATGGAREELLATASAASGIKVDVKQLGIKSDPAEAAAEEQRRKAEADARLAADRQRLLDVAAMEKEANKRAAAAYKLKADTLAEQSKREGEIVNAGGERLFREYAENYQREQDALAANLEVQAAMRQQSHNVVAAEADRAGLRAMEEIKRQYDSVEKYAIGSGRRQAAEARRVYEEMASRPADFAASTIEHFRRVAEEAEREANRTGTVWEQAWMGVEDILKSIPDTIAKAFVSGADLVGAFKAIGVRLYDAVITPLLKGLKVVQQQAVGIGSSLASALGGKVGGQGGATASGIASSLGGAAIAATKFGGAMAGAGVMGSLALSGITFGIGAAVAGVSALVNHFMKAQRELMRINRERDEWIEGLLEGATAQQLLESGGERWRLEIIRVRDAYVAAGRSAREGEDAIRDLWNADNAREYAAAVMEIEHALQLVDLMADGMDALTEASDKYGFTAIKDSADLYESWQVLLAAQHNEIDILTRMSDDFEKLVQDAIKFNTTLDVRLKDPIQKLIDLGEIALEDGTILTDISQLTFNEVGDSGYDAMTRMTRGVETLVAAILYQLGFALDETQRKLLGLSPTAEKLAQMVTDIANGAVNAANGFTPPAPAPPDFTGGTGEGPQAARAGLGETLSRMAGGGRAIIEINGRRLADVLVPEMPGAERRYGLAG